MCRYEDSFFRFLVDFELGFFSENNMKCSGFYVIMINTSDVRFCDKVIREIRTVDEAFAFAPKNPSLKSWKS